MEKSPKDANNSKMSHVLFRKIINFFKLKYRYEVDI